MNYLKTSVIFGFCFFLLTCGIDEYYYIPQVPEEVITSEKNTKAVINIPPNLLNDVSHYATGYVIFYKIYTSNDDNDSIEILKRFPRISSDYTGLSSYTDRTNATSIPSSTTFSGRGYYELDGINIGTVLSINGGSFSINFDPIPGVEPYIEYRGNKLILLRSNGEGKFNPEPEDRYFFSTDDLKDYEKSSQRNPTINADVSGESGIPQNAFVSMYIVAVGRHPRNFTRLYGKPTHISIFKLPQEN
ncbi:hypothetical protein [Treponema sp. R80B11-R83G3]